MFAATRDFFLAVAQVHRGEHATPPTASNVSPPGELFRDIFSLGQVYFSLPGEDRLFSYASAASLAAAM